MYNEFIVGGNFMLTQEDITSIKKSFPFYSKLSSKDSELFLSNVVKKNYKKGENIYNGATQCLGLLKVLKGDLRTYILSEQGKEVTLYRLFPGDFCILTASCILHNITFDVYVDAEEDTTVFLIPAKIYAILNKNVYVENFTYKTTIDHFSDVMWTMEQILFMSFDQRLAIFLLDEYNQKKTLFIPLTHSTVATYMGSAREVVSRMLKYFENEGIVKLSRGGIEILDLEALKSFAHN